MYTVVLMAALGTSIDMPDFGHRRGCHGCSGCYGGCCGGGYGGCCGGGYGGCYGGCGGGCYGGCYGGCCGGAVYGGTPYAAPYSGGSYQGGYYGPAREQVPPGAARPAMPGSTPPKPKPSGGTEEPGQVWGPAPATIVVTLPAAARLTFDGTPTTTTSARRVFNSPPLQPGQAYHYTVTAQIMREGRPINVSQRVNVRAGETSRVSLSFPTTDVAASR